MLCGSAAGLAWAPLMLLDNIVELLPYSRGGQLSQGHPGRRRATEEFVVSAGGVPAAFVFKTVSDQYGKYSYREGPLRHHHARI